MTDWIKRNQEKMRELSNSEADVRGRFDAVYKDFLSRIRAAVNDYNGAPLSAYGACIQKSLDSEKVSVGIPTQIMPGGSRQVLKWERRIDVAPNKASGEILVTGHRQAKLVLVADGDSTKLSLDDRSLTLDEAVEVLLAPVLFPELPPKK